MSSNTTFSPSSLAFENAVNGTTSVLTLTITNNGSSDVTITGPAAPFSMDPASVTVAAGDAVDVSVAFSPTGDADDDYTSTITSDDGGSVAVSGSGLAPVSSDESQTGTHLLMKVDDYTDGLFAKYAEDGDELDEQLTMTSYLRIGLFDYATESDKAKQLLDLIPQVRASTNPNGSPSATSFENFNGGATGAVFSDDVRTRAQDVKDTSVYQDSDTADYGTYTAALACSDDPGNKLTMAQRQAESARLYSRGGWRDHSDGNRISTTYGDKVEVIRGNYKMIVMGRQDDTSQATGWEAGGSHIQDFAPGTMPGASYWLEWINDPRYWAPVVSGDSVDTSQVRQKGVWMLVNTTENVYEYARYAGNFREERWGDVLETYIGSENPPATAWAEDSDEGNDGHEPPHRIEGRSYDYPKLASSQLADCATCSGEGVFYDDCSTCGGDGLIAGRGLGSTCSNCDGSGRVNVVTCSNCNGTKTEGAIDPSTVDDLRATPPWETDNKSKVRSNPHIIEKTWAVRIDSYTGTQSCRIPTIVEDTWAESMTATTNVSGTFTNTFQANNIVESFTADTAVTETKNAAMVDTTTIGRIHEYFFGNFFELFIGGSESLKAGSFIDMTVGIFEVNFDMAATLFDTSIAWRQIELNIAKTTAAAHIGARFAIVTSTEAEMNLGALKASLNSGAVSTLGSALFFG